MKKLLTIEDDPAISLGLVAALSEEYSVIQASDGIIGFNMVKRDNPDLILLDVMLPGKNGLDLCRELRAEGNKTPILMLTSKNEEIDKILGLEIGADDYVTKPFSMRELQARIKALLRRHVELTQEHEMIEFGKIKVNFRKLEAWKESNPLSLSAKKFQILKFFVKHEGEVISRDKLLDEVWGYDNFPTTRTVDNYILSLRKNIEDNPANPNHIITVHTVGYRFLR